MEKNKMFKPIYSHIYIYIRKKVHKYGDIFIIKHAKK